MMILYVENGNVELEVLVLLFVLLLETVYSNLCLFMNHKSSGIGNKKNISMYEMKKSMS